MTQSEYRRHWAADHRARGLCIRCNRRAAPNRRTCEVHLSRERVAVRRPSRVPEVTRDMLLSDLQAVAQRLGYRRITHTTYRREGSFCPTTRLLKRIGMRWSEVCVAAGLLPTQRGCRGIDRRPCERCGEVCNYYGPGQKWCKECRRTLRRRKLQPIGDWSLTTTFAA